MAGRKGKNIMMINDDEAAATHATKRRRIVEFIMNGGGVPFTEFPSTHRNPPPNFIHLQLSPPPPAEIPVQETPNTDDDDDDDVFTSLVSQQNFLINYHMNEMQRNVEEFWRTNLSNEIKKRKELEKRLEEKEQQMVRFREMYYYYEDKAFLLEEKLHHMVAGEGCSNTAAAVVGVEEEVDSCYVVESSRRRRRQLTYCLNCKSSPATMLWLPCRHLCVCLVCEKRVKTCLVCGAKKTESVVINALP